MKSLVELTNAEWEKVSREEFVGKTLRIFLSYSADDKILAGKIKSILGRFNINVFLAHEDIQPLQEWEEELIHNLNNCDIFIPILTKNFLNSDWTSQEIGIAYSKQKLIIPLKIDVAPYGFIGKIQALKVSEDIIEESSQKILEIIGRERLLKENLMDCLIQSLDNVHNFDSADRRLDILKEQDFNEIQINEIFRKAIKNNQIRMSTKGKHHLQKWLSEYSDKIDPFLKTIFQKVQNSFQVFIKD